MASLEPGAHGDTLPFRQLLAEIMERSKIRDSSLARKSGLDPSTINKIRRFDTNPEMPTKLGPTIHAVCRAVADLTKRSHDFDRLWSAWSAYRAPDLVERIEDLERQLRELPGQPRRIDEIHGERIARAFDEAKRLGLPLEMVLDYWEHAVKQIHAMQTVLTQEHQALAGKGRRRKPR